MPIKRQKKRKKKKQMRNDAHSLFVFDIAMQKRPLQSRVVSWVCRSLIVLADTHQSSSLDNMGITINITI